MNGITRKKKYQEIVQRDGEYCKCCGKLSYECQLVIDHRDNNSNNNSLNNLQLLCRSCNYIKNPRKEPFDLCVSSESNETCLSINRSKERKFRDFILGTLVWEDSMKFNEAINMGAEKIGISPVTAKRYLDKMTSEYGPLHKVSNGIDLTIIYRKSEERLAELGVMYQ